MTLPRQNSAWVDGDGRPTRDLYNWARSVSVPVASSAEALSYALGDLSNVRISGLTNGDTLVWSNTQGKWVNTTAALTSASSALSADVTLDVSGNWYDGPTVSLSAGTWLVTATATFFRGATTQTTWFARISDGTTHYASTQAYSPSVIGSGVSCSLQAIVTLASAATIKLQATTNAGAAACSLKAATTSYGSGNNSTIISAFKLA